MKDRLFLCALLLLGSVWLSGCAAQTDEGTSYLIYCRANPTYASGGDAVCAVPVSAGGETAEAVAGELLHRLFSEEGETYGSAVPAGTRLLEVRVENGQALVNVSEDYGTLSGIDLTVADYCIALTLCQLPEVDRVSVLVEGVPLPYRDSQSFSASDVLLSHMDEELRTLRARLFFRNEETGELTGELRTLRLYEGQTKAAAVLDALLQGPESETLGAVIPAGVTVESVRVDQGVCHVSLSAEFLENIPEDVQIQENVVYSIVRSLCSLSDVQAVQLTVGGEAVSRYGTVDVSVPLS